ncbi:MAG: cryptochrome/photolyase family protein [Gammaproteobacteria bacterium]|nr:cryptochrome/photolyase family protein [Gammaproteobacteria bacterium]
MSALRLLLADQLSHTISSLTDIDKKNDVVLMCEVMEEATYVKHHVKKIAFLFSAMRHFALELEDQGITVRYIKLNDKDNTGTFSGEIERAIADVKPNRVIVTEPGEYRVLEYFKSWETLLNIPVEIRTDDRFLCSTEEFNQWADGKKQLRMEFFYREMRKKYKILLDAEGDPEGGAWNYDKENRKPPKCGMVFPKRISHKKSKIVKEVLQLVSDKFSDHFGVLEPFHFAVTRKQALLELEHFIKEVLPDFGEYQDAMVAGEPYGYHSLLSSYINAGLLLPLEICRKAEAAYRAGKVSISSAEGLIRQILGWREYVRGIYWHYMPRYADLNFFNAVEPLPEFYWTADTQMSCVAEAVRHTRDHAYSHHIQRLMLTGNFALLAGLDVKQVQEWYLAVYSDAYEWVEMPNTLGMALFGDGGLMASKPYAASGKYINRMSNFCKNCHYDPEETVGENACPFNSLYWNFLAKNKEKLINNQRMVYMFSTWNKFSPEKKQAILDQARLYLQQMREAKL